VTIMRFVTALMIFLATVAPAPTQPWAPEFVQSEQAFNSLPVDTRITFQVLLTAAGYWPAVPNVTYSGRLNGAVRRFQIDHGFRPTGMLNAAELDKLIDIAAPMLNMWEFQGVGHPDRGRPIWVPFGLGLQVERVDGGVRWRDAYRRVSLLYTYKPNKTVESAYQSALSAFIRSGAAIEFKVARRDFYAISAGGADGIDSYTRYHQDGTGVLGFLLTWRRDDVDLHIERVATLISGSLWSSMTGAAFIDPPKPSPGQNAAVASPVQPLPLPGFPKQAPKKEGASSGSGFFVTNKGHVLTNAHVVEECASIRVTTDERNTSQGFVLAQDTINDLAVVETTLKPTKVAALRPSIRLGESVAAFGYPLTDILSISGNFTLGNVTALAGLKDDSRYLQISAPVQPGNSGGPLFDQNGNVVGVVTAKLNALKLMVGTDGDIAQNVNFAIKSAVAANFLETNRVKFSRGSSDVPMQSADLADQARATSVFIRCF
jgi:serine protease Do